MTNTSDKTNRIKLKYLHQNQAYKERIINENYDYLDALINKGVISSTIPTPPKENKFGDMYIIPKNSTGAWSENTSNIAFYLGDEWQFIPPSNGAMLWDCNLNTLLVFSNDEWITPLKHEQ